MDFKQLSKIGFLSKMKSVQRLSRLEETAEFQAANEYGDKKEWYFTAEAKEKYDALKTVFDKTWFIYLYIRCAHKQNYMLKDEKELKAFKIAYVLASALDGTSLPMSSYPDIINEDKNPLIGIATDQSKYQYKKDGELLKEICTTFKLGTAGKYSVLVKANDGEYTEKYKLQRMILWLLADSETLEKGAYDIDKYSKRKEIEIKIRTAEGLDCDAQEEELELETEREYTEEYGPEGYEEVDDDDFDDDDDEYDDDEDDEEEE